MHQGNELLQLIQGGNAGHARFFQQILTDAQGAEGVGGGLVAKGDGVHAAVRIGVVHQGLGIGDGLVVGHVAVDQILDIHDIALVVALHGPLIVGEGGVKALAGENHTVGHLAGAVLAPRNELNVHDAVDLPEENLGKLLLAQFLHAGGLVAVEVYGDLTGLLGNQGRIDDVGRCGGHHGQHQRKSQDDGCQTLEHGKTSLRKCIVSAACQLPKTVWTLYPLTAPMTTPLTM